MNNKVINMLRRVATDLQAFGEQGLPPDAPDSFLLLLELIYRDILVYEQLNVTSGAGTLVSSALATMRGLNEQQQHEYTFSHPTLGQLVGQDSTFLKSNYNF